MDERYNPSEIEKKWQKIWEEKDLYKTPNSVPGKENYYQLVEFAYPSGNLHVGHWYAFAVPDIHARYQRMKGKNVLYPFGFDAFGLPAENAAIKNNKDPKEWTTANIDYMRGQLKSMGAMFDWSREVVTCDPSYYRWTQWLFIQLFKAGLVEQSETLANWCPNDKTVLANEQVVNGNCERCGAVIEKKKMKQWQVKITKYADRLLEDLENLDWPEEIKTSQKNWIGRSEGMLFTAPVKDTNLTVQTFSAHFEAFSADTFVVIAPNHPFLPILLEGVPDKENILQRAREMVAQRELAKYETKEIEGVFTGRYIIDPVGNGDLPIWIANYALAEYGTGIVKCSAHDERDFAFAKKYNIPLKPVLFPKDEVTRKQVEDKELCFADMEQGVLTEPLEFSGKKAGTVREEIVDYLVKKNLATKKITYRLRDWGVSRQRYWGCPIPLVHCEQCGWQAVPDNQLPVELPPVSDYLPNDEGQSPLSKNSDFVHTTCPKCNGAATRETDTLDTFVDSSWYFLRYCDPQNQELFANKEILKNWLPVNHYSGGAEHTTLHILYSRFFHKALFDLGLVNEAEPYVKRMSRSLILGPDGNKMSKSKGNVIDPDPIVAELGADTMRMYLAFIGPYNEVSGYPWNPEGVIGVHRFLERVWKLAGKVSTDNNPDVEKIESILHKTLAAVEESITSFKMNTGVAALMTCSNELKPFPFISPEHIRFYAQMLAPYAPHLAEEIWSMFGGADSIHTSVWPSYDAKKVIQETLKMAVQVNGKTRSVIEVTPEMSEQEVQELALKDEKVQVAIAGKEIKKVIVVRQKVVNIVISTE